MKRLIKYDEAPQLLKLLRENSDLSKKTKFFSLSTEGCSICRIFASVLVLRVIAFTDHGEEGYS